MAMSNLLRSRGGVVASISALAVAAALLAATPALTEAQRSTTHFAAAELYTSVQPVLNLEGSTDNATWGGSATLDFGPEQMALAVGEENAVYASLFVRPGAGTNAAASVTVTETGLLDTGFAHSLRSQIYVDPPSCDESGIGAQQPIASGALRGQSTSRFGLDAPEIIGEAGDPVELCVQVWMNDNNWLLGGTIPPTDTATWEIAATTTN